MSHAWRPAELGKRELERQLRAIQRRGERAARGGVLERLFRKLLGSSQFRRPDRTALAAGGRKSREHESRDACEKQRYDEFPHFSSLTSTCHRSRCLPKPTRVDSRATTRTGGGPGGLRASGSRSGSM